MDDFLDYLFFIKYQLAKNFLHSLIFLNYYFISILSQDYEDRHIHNNFPFLNVYY